MATEVEYVNYKDFVAGLESTENPGVDDVTVVSNETDGPRVVPANTSALSNTATDSDLTADASVDLQTASGKKKAPANLFAKQSGLETTNGNVTALTNYVHKVAHSVAQEFVPNSTITVAGYPYMYNGSLYMAKEEYQGPWDVSKFKVISVSDYFAVKNYTSQSVVSDNNNVNKVIKELYFSTPVSLSDVTVRIYNNRLSTSNDYLLGVVFTIGVTTYNVYKRSNSLFTDKLIYFESSSVKAVLDLTLVSVDDVQYTHVNLMACVNHLESNPYIYAKSYLAEQVAENSNNIQSNRENIENLNACFEEVVSDRNMFDKNNTSVLNLYVSAGKFTQSASTRLMYIACRPNTTYTFSVGVGLCTRFSLFSSENVPVNNGNCTIYSPTSTDAYSRKYYTFETGPNDNYIGVYYYNALYVAGTEEQILASLMVSVGDVIFDYENYWEKLVLKENNLPSAVVAAVKDDAFTTRTKSYGVAFNNSIPSSVCARVGDAYGKKSNYAIGSSMAIENQENDFDNIYPWCDIKRCNIVDGEVIAYEGDSSFKIDGSNGDVFVEIPKFYSYRSVIGDIETIVISGTKKAGFSLEPAFAGNGNDEKEYIYVAAYATDFEGESKAGNTPQTWKKFNDFYDEAGVKGYDVYDIAVLNAIQKLVLIENADKRISNKYDGYGYIPYYNPNMTAIETASGVNTFEIKGGTADRFKVGQNISYLPTTQSNDDIRVITALTEPVWDSSLGGYRRTVTLSGSPIDVVSGETLFYGVQQNNGGCDGVMTYHTGRAGENGLSACRYRWMENLWGNVWMQTAGIVVKDLEYYFTYDKAKYKSELSQFIKVLDFGTPEQNHYPSTDYGWLVANGLVQGNKNLILPKIINTASQSYYSAKLYSIGLVDQDGNAIPAGTEFVCVSGGGWDHMDRNSPFTLRFWSTRTGGAYSHLYGSRYVIR